MTTYKFDLTPQSQHDMRLALMGSGFSEETVKSANFNDLSVRSRTGNELPKILDLQSLEEIDDETIALDLCFGDYQTAHIRIHLAGQLRDIRLGSFGLPLVIYNVRKFLSTFTFDLTPDAENDIYYILRGAGLPKETIEKINFDDLKLKSRMTFDLPESKMIDKQTIERLDDNTFTLVFSFDKHRYEDICFYIPCETPDIRLGSFNIPLEMCDIKNPSLSICP